jgi:hypothetical protein
VDQDVAEDTQNRHAIKIGSAKDGVLTFKIQKQTLENELSTQDFSTNVSCLLTCLGVNNDT